MDSIWVMKCCRIGLYKTASSEFECIDFDLVLAPLFSNTVLSRFWHLLMLEFANVTPQKATSNDGISKLQIFIFQAGRVLGISTCGCMKSKNFSWMNLLCTSVFFFKEIGGDSQLLMVQKSGVKTSWYGKYPHYLQDFIHVRWCRISSTNRMAVPFSMNPLSWILFFLASRNSAPTKNNGNKKGGNKYRDHYNVMGIINKLQNVAGNLQGFQDLAYYNSAWSLGWCFSSWPFKIGPYCLSAINGQK